MNVPTRLDNSPRAQHPDFSPARWCLIYLILAIGWILIGGKLVPVLKLGLASEYLIGFGFALATTALLYRILARAQAKLTAYRAAASKTGERFQYVVENAAEGIFVQTGGCFRYLNSACSSYFGATAADLMDRPIIDRIHPDFRARARERMEASNRNEAVPLLACKALRLDGSVFDIELSAVPLPDGDADGTVVFLRDITDRVRTEAERRELEAEFQQAQRLESIGRLAGGIAHDLNNHLTVISGYTELLIQRIPPWDPMRASLVEVRDAGDRAAVLTSQLMAFSRKGALNPKILDINAIVNRAAKRLDDLIGRDVSVITEIQPGAGTILADEARLEQVFLNLAVNAKDAMPAGGTITMRTSRLDVDPALAATLPGAHPGPAVQVSFSDTGTGIEPAILGRIFEPFFTTKREGLGTGLGLSTVYGIVKQFGGWVGVASELGHGTTFNLYLPRYSDAAAPSGSEEAVGQPARGGETILLVEDYGPLREFAAAALTGCGYTVLDAPNGNRALSILNESRAIHLLLTDLVMPGLNGRELAAEARKLRGDLAVLFISGYADTEVAQRGEIDGCSILPKPFTGPALAHRVRATLDARG